MPLRAARIWRSPKVVTVRTALLVVLAPLLALVTYMALSGIWQSVGPRTVRGILLADLIYLLTVATLVAYRVATLVMARRRKLAGARLHLRLTSVFAFMALAPTILVAVFATVTVSFGVEGWFSSRVQSVVTNSLEAAVAYESEHRQNLAADAVALAGFLDTNKSRFPLISDGELRELLTSGQQSMQREVSEAYIIDGSAILQVRGDLSYLFDYEMPGFPVLDAARESGQPQIVEDWSNNELRAVVHLPSFADRYLYITRAVDGNILNLLDETQSTVALYQQLEGARGRLLFELGLLYFGFALIVVLGAVWLAFWFADRLSRPVVRLAGAAERIGAGDLTVRVREDEGEDEIAVLSRVFNRMTRQVKRQRDDLVTARMESERRGRIFEAVLTGVSAGVMGLDDEGRVEVVNNAALDLVHQSPEMLVGRPLGAALPAFAPLFDRLKGEHSLEVQDQVSLSTPVREEELLVRITRHKTDPGSFGSVVTFDSITDLVSAQRMAAWGDVARRIAHEIKNPLTPIQLSAERMKRKYAGQIAEGRDGFEKIADVIVRQTNDLRRIVDEFSKFARLPEPVLEATDLTALVEDVALLQRDAWPDITFQTVSDLRGSALVDPGLMSQALGNLVKNAGEAVQTRLATEPDDQRPAEVIISLSEGPEGPMIRISDTGLGLPENQPGRLFEPYVTHRDGGTGLGLAIVKKIIEDHGGTLTLASQPQGGGAEACVLVPRVRHGSEGPTKEQKDPIDA